MKISKTRELLDISNTEIESLPLKISNFKNLKQLTLKGNPLPQEKIIRIKSALPNTEVLV